MTDLTILRGDARNLPLPDASVDLIVTSPPYFALRSYTDGGEHYAGQIDPRAGKVRSIIHDGATAGGHGKERTRATYTPIGEACACPDTSAPTRPAVVLDPFGGTGTTALVASVLGRHGISVDMSADYCRLARWRTTDPGQRAKAARVPAPPKQMEGQADLFGEWAS